MKQKANGIHDLNAAVDSPSQWLIDAFSVPRTSGRIEVNSCEIQYYRWGNPEKPSLVLMHGFLAHSGCWAFIAPFLANNFDVIAFDMSGMGDSGWREAYGDEVRSNELIEFCNQFKLFNKEQKPIIATHSYGGRVASYAISKNPELFRGLIICDLMIIRPSILAKHQDKFRAPGTRDPKKQNRIYPNLDVAKTRFVLSPPQQANEPELFDFMAYHSLRPKDGGWQWKFDPNLFAKAPSTEVDWSSIGAFINELPIKKTIIFGEKSMLFTPDSVDYMTELMRANNEQYFPMIGIPDAHHHLMLDQPQAFLTALRAALATWDSSN